MKNIFYFFIFLSLVACQIEDKDAPTPSESYIKYFGEANTSYDMVDMEVIYDANDSTMINSVIMLGTRQQEDARSDIYLVKTDAIGTFIADTAYSFDLDSDDVATHLSRAGDNILVVGNTSTSPPGGLNGVIWNEFTTDLTPVSQPHPDTTLYSIFTDPTNPTRISANDMIQTNDGNFVMVGNYITQSGDQQYYRLKIDATQKGNISYPSSASNSDPALVWFFSAGVGAEDDLVRVFEEDNGGLVFIGNSSFSDIDGNGGVNVIVINATSTGSTSNRRSYGFNLNENSPNATDKMADAIAKQGGYAIVGTSTQGNSSQAFFIDTGAPSLRRLLTSSFTLNDVGIKTEALGITQGANNDFMIVGRYPDFRIDTSKGQENKRTEAMIYRTDQFGLPIAGLETNYGLILGDDKAVVAKTLPDGKILVGATIDFGNSLMSLLKLNDSGQLDK